MVVLGGSRGIGAAVARMAAARGWSVALTYHSGAAEAQALADEIVAAGGLARALPCDVADEASIARTFAAAAALGPVGAMVYSSGITGAASQLAQAEVDTLRQVVEVNLLGAMLAAREAVRAMPQGGAITFISSRAADRGSAGEYVWYAATKGGVNSLATGLSKEVAAQGIRVNCVSPGPVATEMLSPQRQAQGAAAVPMQRVGQPQEIAEAVLFLSSDAASYVTGANLAVAGGA
jgi:NAD(P)-dependent dehydrogenase (short-subunit alcohol dehydrogenase family)